MAIKKTAHKRLILLIVLLSTGFTSVLKASHEVGTARLSSPDITVNNTLFIQDNKYSAIASMPNLITWGFADQSFKNKLTLGIDRYNTASLANFVATVTLQVTSTEPQAYGGMITIVTKTLSISYEGRNDHSASSSHTSVDRDVYSFLNGYKVLTKITGISVTSSDPSLVGSTMPANVYLEAETDADRYYPLPQNASPFVHHNNVNIKFLDASEEFEISWTRINGAEQYDLEWLWLDEKKNAYWINNPELDFRNNSTRVRTSQQSYKISNVFEEGQIFFRIRGVGKAGLPNAWEKTTYTPWSWEDLTVMTSNIVSTSTVITAPAPTSGTNHLFYLTLDGTTAVSGNSIIPQPHEFNKNWQYKATYAEEGKKKEVVSYFDGSLRSRQSVTKNNSDNNAVVGETYYDYNGRAAVQALPVPVADAKIKFYQYNVTGGPAFNVNLGTTTPYTKKSFDEDATAGATVCTVASGGLDPSLGSSNYYSDQNLHQQFAQGYVPSAENFPISQTVFTNDNTGRIAAQGGVGKTHQIGTGRETRYFYSTPDQVTLDRLFGSEVGYSKHYKENMVIDANGQVSMSYTDQEGRTIATALAGQTPSNVAALKDASGNPLYPAPTATNVINADLLNKVHHDDFDTELDNNMRNGDELTFSKKILVPSASTYTLSYDLLGTTFTYSCLPTSPCYDCVYDLEIDIFDNCMNNPPGFTKVTHTLGNIIPPSVPNGLPSPTYTLDLVCNDVVKFSTSQLSSTGNQLYVDLAQGEYTIVKKLKTNQAAISFYLEDFLKSDCVKKPSDFENVTPDTSGCGLTCDECVAALGSRDTYTLSGKGSLEDWQREYAICREPCEYVSICDAEYITMLADVSPGGQYGDWQDNQGNCAPGNYPLSVYNQSNKLPFVKNFNVGFQVPDWRFPFLRKSIYNSDQASDFATEYREDDGTPSFVYVTKMTTMPLTYYPPVRTGAVATPVNTVNTGVGAQYYVKPEELDDVADFIANWKNSWAKSLVFYHPEYAYYDWCLKNTTDTLTAPYAVTIGTGTNAVTGYVNNSDHYDSLLLVTDDIVGLLPADLTILGQPLDHDPYWTKNGKYYDFDAQYTRTVVGTTHLQKTTGPITGISSPWDGLYLSANYRYEDYQGSGLSLPAFVAVITTSCAIQYGQPIGHQLNCAMGVLNSTGGTAITSSVTVNGMTADAIIDRLPTTLKNKYWDSFRMMYLALKQEMQQEAAESYAMNGNYRGCNGGIGNPNFDPNDVPFTKYLIHSTIFGYPGGSYNTESQKQWFHNIRIENKPQYCGFNTLGLYTNKIKRFPNSQSAKNLAATMPGGDPGAAIYSSTGLCPNAFYFQNLLNSLAVSEQLSDASINLSTVPEFNPDLYTVVAGGTIPSVYTQADWTGSYSSGTLNAAMQIGSNPPCPLTLNFPSGSSFNFTNTGNGGTYAFLKLYHMIPGTVSSGSYNFTIRADIADASGSTQTYTTVTLDGNTCIPLTACSFTPPCEPTPPAIALQKLMNAIAATGNMCTAAIPMSDVNIAPYFTNVFAPLLGNGTWEWSRVGATSQFVIKDISAIPSTNSISITMAGSPCAGSGQLSFTGINGSNSGNNVFNIILTSFTTGTAVTTNTAVTSGTITVNGQTLPMGNCSFDISKCITPAHDIARDLKNFLANPNTSGHLQAPSTNFTPFLNFGFGLRAQLADNYYAFTTATVTTDPLSYYWKRDLAASSATLLTGSFMATTLTTVPSPDSSACSFSLSFANTIGLSGQNLLSSTYTLGNFTLAPGPVINSSIYNFSVTANFTGTPFILKGTSSCFGMKACGECVSPSAIPSFNRLDILNTFPCTGAAPYTLTEQVSGVSTTYTNAGNCTLTTTVSNLEQSINSTVDFSGDATWHAYTGGNGSSLFFKLGAGTDFAYKQNFSVQHAQCIGGNSIKMKVHKKNDGNDQVYGLGNDFVLRINGVAVSNGYVSSFPIDAEWSQFAFSGFPLNTGSNQLSITDLNTTETNFAIDDIILTQDACAINFLPCPNNDSLVPLPEIEYEDPCVQYALEAAENEGNELYNAYIDSVKIAFVQDYIRQCIGRTKENMRLQYNAANYHFTLYYYDQAGNLVRTIPPQGVHVETNPLHLATIITERADKLPYSSKTYYTSHTLPTTYKYNSLNQLVKQETPDGGISRFWYDALGRLVASQNAKQLMASSWSNYVYSYTRYDALGRIAQVGEMTIGSDLSSMSAVAVATLVASGTLPYPQNLTGSMREVTSTYYGDDENFTPLVSGSNFTSGDQEYLRSRVAAVTLEDVADGSMATYNHATHYSYDVHGNVKELIQENKDISLFGYQQLKKLSYSYDLISGKVNEVAYQRDLKDMFLHRYEYDADNRITAVYTSKDDVVWERDAKYFYYLHGPLARVETGHDKVQGTDYAYTLHGWIKGVNSNVLKDANDIGKDGRGALTTSGAYVNKFNGRDVFGYSLTYYNNATQKDYSGINGLSGTSTDFIAAAPSVQTADLYNGNIRQMTSSYLDASSPGKTYALSALLKNFTYDQLNRIETATSNDNLNAAGNSWGASLGGAKYSESFSYDQNGNILGAQRNGHQSGSLAMDALTYHYISNTNKLAYVSDAISGDPYSTDISNQSAGNYDYDAIGNLVKDNAEGISNIDWTVYGKIRRITFSNGKPNLLFKYDASGNRISKTAYIGSTPTNTATTTYYVRDAQGNVMAAYEQKPDVGNNPTINLTERHIYGSSRLGLETTILNVTTYSNTLLNTTSVTRTLGYRSYEMTNHLGNVLATISDRKISVDVANDGTTDYFTGEVLSAQDYFVFGGTMPGRSFSSSLNQYRYGMNGKEKDDEISLYNYGFRMYDPRLGRFISVDPVARQFPFFSPYQYAGNKPIWATDLDGLETNYTNAVDPVPSEQPLYGRRDESDPHTESLQVGKQGTDWRYSTQQLFHWHDGNIKWKSLPGQQTIYFEQLTPVCKVVTYKTIITEKQIVTPEQKAEYRVINKQTNIARQGTIVGANVNVTQLSNTASMLVGFRTDEAIADNGTPISINFVVQNINDPNIASIRNAIQASSGLPVNLTQDPNILSQYQYSVNYKKTIQTKAAVPGTTTTVKTEEKVPVESYAPCTPSSGSTSGTTEQPPQ